MITLYLWQLRWRIVAVAVVCLGFYLIEPSFHVHAAAGSADYVPPGEIAFTLANLAAASMLVLLTDFISGDRRRGYFRIYFSHPTRPVSFYALRWTVAYAVTMLIVCAFFILAQLAAWGEIRAGVGSLAQPALFALIYGAVLAFFSVVLPVGDGAMVLSIYFLTDLWLGILGMFEEAQLAPPGPFLLRQAVSFVLPPHLALRDAYDLVVTGGSPWAPVSFAAGYGVFWLALAGLLLWRREWP
ncbi:hypothetical protein [Longimicrobium sp.]|uniref:hypothetical protein n=1 Tax=Longimicrobium sp. TaxID=2029185 RepID=UPI002CAE9B53|nr:hypothetical protein [Longimicrobium sp.]HSU14253.1 hypothetical protein [Longimicrobium sp.]